MGGAVERLVERRHAIDGRASGTSGKPEVSRRESLLEFISVAQDAAVWTDDPPKRADFRSWTEIIFDDLLPGGSNKERRGAIKSSLESAWTFANWLTHAKSGTWTDTDMACDLTQHAVGMAVSLVVRALRGVPSECPDCGSPRLEPEEGENSGVPGILWERPCCSDCGWAGRPVPVAEFEGGESIITREGETNDDHSIMTVPLRTIVRPGDPPILPLAGEEAEAAPSLLYFAYGSNMSTARLRARTPNARALGTAVLSGHVLRFHKRSKDRSGKCDAFETGDSTDRVIGVLYAIDPAERQKLDAAEGLNKGYRDAMVTVVDAQDRRRKALVYLATPDSIDGSLKPYSWYRGHVLAGSVEHALPAEYVREFVESVDAQPDQNQERERRERSV